jgi:hypothetical protein
MTTAIIDGDVVAYMCCRNRIPKVDGKVLILETLPEYTPEEDAAYFESSWIRFKEIVKELCELCFTDNYQMAVKGEGNFRDIIYPEYKANRSANVQKKNPFVPLLRQRAVDEGLAVPADGMEADDYLRIWQQEHVAQGKDYVICSIDKDLRCMPGRHYLMHQNTFLNVTEEYAMRFYYEQLLKGDPTDNIKGIPRVGDKKAKDLLVGCITELDFQTTVIHAYQAAFEEADWKRELLLTGRLIYLLKTFDDEFTLDGWPELEYQRPVEAEVKAKKKRSGKAVDVEEALIKNSATSEFTTSVKAAPTVKASDIKWPTL